MEENVCRYSNGLEILIRYYELPSSLGTVIKDPDCPCHTCARLTQNIYHKISQLSGRVLLKIVMQLVFMLSLKAAESISLDI